MIPWFSTLGFALPYGVNVADFLLDLAQGEVEGGDFRRLVTAAAGDSDQDDQHTAADTPPATGSLVGAPAIRALYSSYETFKQRHPDGFTGHEQQVAELRLALDPPLTKKQRAAAAAAIAAGKDPAAAVAAAGRQQSRKDGSSGSFLERSLHKAGSFLGLDTLSEQHRAKSDSDDDDDENDESASDSPSFKRSITRIWSHSSKAHSLSQSSSPPPDEEAGCVGGVTRRLGVADRGGASYSTQLQVLLTRQVKVSGGAREDRGEGLQEC